MLTHTAIAKAKPADKPYKLQREQGLFILINPNDGKWRRFAYSFGGKEKLLSLGNFPLVSLPDARKLRDEAHKLVAAGIDPSEHRRSEREAKAVGDVGTFSAVVECWKADELASTSEGYSSKVIRVFERDVLPYIGERPIAEIKTRELVSLLHCDFHCRAHRRRPAVRYLPGNPAFLFADPERAKGDVCVN